MYNYTRCPSLLTLALAVMPALLPAQQAAPLTVTRGARAEPPALPAKAFTVSDTLESVAIPLDGWKVV